MYTFKKYILNITILSIVFYLGACSAGPDDPGTEYAPNMYHAIPYEPLKQITDEDAGNWVSSIDEDHGEYYNSNPVNPYNITIFFQVYYNQCYYCQSGHKPAGKSIPPKHSTKPVGINGHYPIPGGG